MKMKLETRKFLFLATTITILALSASMAISAATPTAEFCTLVVQNHDTGAQSWYYHEGDYIDIVWDADANVNIVVMEKVTNTIVYSNTDAAASGTVNLGQLDPGKYQVTVSGVLAGIIDVDTFFVIPESAFGALAALGTGIAVFGGLKLKRKI